MKDQLIISSHKQFWNLACNFDNQNKVKILTTITEIGKEVKSKGLHEEPIGKYYWSYRVDRDIRIIGVKTKNEITLVYIGHHEDAYRYCSCHTPVFVNKKYVCDSEIEEGKQFEPSNKYDFLKEKGFDDYFIQRLNNCKTRIDILKEIKFLAPEYQELILSEGKEDEVINGYSSEILVLNDDETLKRALLLDYPDWCIFLHPKQVIIRDADIHKNIFVVGGPGTGKTVTMVWRFIKIYRESKDKKPLFLCRSGTTALIVKNMIKQIDPSIEPIIEEFPHNNAWKPIYEHFIKFSHIVIDEGQDLSDFALSFLSQKTRNGDVKFPNVSIAFDTNQSILNINSKKSLMKMRRSYTVFTLTYCYRSTEQIIDFAKNKLSTFNPNGIMETSLNFECPLLGNDVLEKNLNEQNDVEKIIDTFLQDKHIDENNPNWCIIFAGFFDDDFFYYLSNKYKEHVYDTEQAKGKEFFVGIVLHYYIESNPPKTEFDFKKVSYEPYVGLTRFRDSCYYIHINKAYDNERNKMKAQSFNPEALIDSYICNRCHKTFKGLPGSSKPIVTGHDKNRNDIKKTICFCPECTYDQKQEEKYGKTKWQEIKNRRKKFK